MGNQVRIGVIGTSWWTDMMFLSSFGSHPQANVVAICGRNRDRAEEMARKHKITHVYTNYRHLIDNGDLDAVVVATPDDLHYGMTMAALDAGLHVLCEKPMALNVENAKEMYKKAEDQQVKHMVLFSWRWLPHFRFAKQLVDEGYIGRCYHADFGFLGGFAREASYSWRADGQRSNGVVSDLGAHMIDFARWYVGEIDSVCAHLNIFVEVEAIDDRPLIPTNDAASLFLQTRNNAQIVVRVSNVAARGDRVLDLSVRLYGESGTLEVDQSLFGPDPSAEVRLARSSQEPVSILEIPSDLTERLDKSDPFDPFYKLSVGPRLFVDSIIEDKPIVPNFYDGMKVQEVIDAALKSNNEKRWVSLA